MFIIYFVVIFTYNYKNILLAKNINHQIIDIIEEKTLLDNSEDIIYNKSIDEDVMIIDHNNNFTKDSDDLQDKMEDELLTIIVEDNNESYNEILKQLKLAYNFFTLGHYETSLELYKNILKKYPDNEDALYGKSVSYHNLGQYIEAKEIYYKLLQSNPKNIDKNNIISNLLDILIYESPNDALFLLKKLLIYNSDSASITAYMGNLYKEIGDLNQAKLYLQKAINIDPNIEYKMNLAVIYDTENNYEKAIILYNEILNEYLSKESYFIKDIDIAKISKRLEFLKNNL